MTDRIRQVTAEMAGNLCYYGLSPESAAEQGLVAHIVCPDPDVHEHSGSPPMGSSHRVEWAVASDDGEIYEVKGRTRGKAEYEAALLREPDKDGYSEPGAHVVMRKVCDWADPAACPHCGHDCPGRVAPGWNPKAVQECPACDDASAAHLAGLHEPSR